MAKTAEWTINVEDDEHGTSQDAIHIYKDNVLVYLIDSEGVGGKVDKPVLPAVGVTPAQIADALVALGLVVQAPRGP